MMKKSQRFNDNLKRFAACMNNKLYDAECAGGQWVVKALETLASLDDFEKASKEWAECDHVRIGEISGLPFRSWAKVRIHKNFRRSSLSVIDFGDVRIVLPGTDLSLFEQRTEITGSALLRSPG